MAGAEIPQAYEYRNVYLLGTNMDCHQSVCGGTRSTLITEPRSLRSAEPVKIRVEERTDYTCPDIEPIAGRVRRLICLIPDRLAEEARHPTSSLGRAIIPRGNLNRNGVVRLPLSAHTILVSANN